MTMVRSLGIRLAGVAALSVLLGCIPPSDQRPGLWLSGDEAAFPPDWSFSDAHREIALEVGTPYGLRHSVTIWCASLDGRLYVAARDPDEKRWPGWVEDRPDVRIGVDGRIYEGAATPSSTSGRIRRRRTPPRCATGASNPEASERRRRAQRGVAERSCGACGLCPQADPQIEESDPRG
jgi:hypothetical protein